MILNASNICLNCGGYKDKAAERCEACDGKVRRPNVGRKARYTDDQILAAIDRPMTVDTLMTVLDVKHKSTLITRLRRLRDDGRIMFQDDGARRDGYRIIPKGEGQ